MVLLCLPGFNGVGLPTVCCSAYSAVLCFIPACKLCQLESCAENCGVRTLLHGFVKITSVFDKVCFTNGLGHLSMDPVHLC